MMDPDKMVAAIEVLAEYLTPGTGRLDWLIEPSDVEGEPDGLAGLVKCGERSWGLGALIAQGGDEQKNLESAKRRVTSGLLHGLLCEAAMSAVEAARKVAL